MAVGVHPAGRRCGGEGGDSSESKQKQMVNKTETPINQRDAMGRERKKDTKAVERTTVVGIDRE